MFMIDPKLSLYLTNEIFKDGGEFMEIYDPHGQYEAERIKVECEDEKIMFTYSEAYEETTIGITITEGNIHIEEYCYRESSIEALLNKEFDNPYRLTEISNIVKNLSTKFNMNVYYRHGDGESKSYIKLNDMEEFK